MENDSQVYTLIRYYEDELSSTEYNSMDELISDCEEMDIDTELCFICKGKLELMRLEFKLTAVDIEEEEEITTLSIEEKFKSVLKESENERKQEY